MNLNFVWGTVVLQFIFLNKGEEMVLPDKVIHSIFQIREETNTRIDLPAENSNSEMIVITGKKENCEAARIRILSIQKELVTYWLFSGCLPSKMACVLLLW